MDNKDFIDFNPHFRGIDIGKLAKLGAPLPDMDKYASPITGVISQYVEQIEKAREDAICATICEKYDVQCNREELIKALTYDRNQYAKGYADATEKWYAKCQDIRNWTPCKQALPETTGYYEVTVDNPVLPVQIMLYEPIMTENGCNLWHATHDSNYCLNEYVQAWKPLPAKYTPASDMVFKVFGL